MGFWYNPIESMWAYAKRRFYKEEALLDVNAKFDSVERRVQRAIKSVSASTMENCVHSVLQQAHIFQLEHKPDEAMPSMEHRPLVGGSSTNLT